MRPLLPIKCNSQTIFANFQSCVKVGNNDCKKPGPRLTPSAHDGLEPGCGQSRTPAGGPTRLGGGLGPERALWPVLLPPGAGAVSSLWKSLKPLRIVLSHRPPSVTPYQTLFRFVRKADYDDINIQKRRRETKKEP